jgi:hypothetical protein
MHVSVFLSHTAADKPFVRKLAGDLEGHGVRYWLDEAEIKVGESLIEKIRQGLDEVDYVAVILSPRSVASAWVRREVDVAMNQEIQGRRVKVLPIVYQACELPCFLLGKFYADFTDESKYAESFKRLVESMGVVFNRRALEACPAGPTLGSTIDRAIGLNLRIYSRPFHRPFQYIGMNVADAAKEVGQAPNEGGRSEEMSGRRRWVTTGAHWPRRRYGYDERGMRSYLREALNVSVLRQAHDDCRNADGEAQASGQFYLDGEQQHYRRDD